MGNLTSRWSFRYFIGNVWQGCFSVNTDRYETVFQLISVFRLIQTGKEKKKTDRYETKQSDDSFRTMPPTCSNVSENIKYLWSQGISRNLIKFYRNTKPLCYYVIQRRLVCLKLELNDHSEVNLIYELNVHSETQK